MTGKEKGMEMVRASIKTASNATLLEMWETSRQDMTVLGMAVNAIIEAELECRNLIRLNEDTCEYEVADGQRCPVCGKVYTERPAISRKDGKTAICPDCGTQEAIAAFVQAQKGR